MIRNSAKTHNKKPLVVSVGDYVSVQVSKNARAYALVVNLLEDGDAKDLYLTTNNYFRADVVYLFNVSMLAEAVLNKLRKLIRCK